MTTGLIFAPPVDDETGRRFEREITPTSRLSGMKASLAESFLTGPIPRIFNAGEDAFDAAFSPEKLEQNRIAREQAEAERIDTISRMPPGIQSGVARFGGGIAGFSLDPLNMAATVFAPEFIGTKIAPLLDGLAEKLPVAARAVRGAAEGVGVVAPGEAVKLAAAKVDPYQTDYKSTEAMSNILLAAGLGGIVDAVIGSPITPMTSDTVKQGMDAATGQMASGNAVDVEPIITKGYHEARLKMADDYQEKLAIKRNRLSDEIQATDKELTIQKATVQKVAKSVAKDSEGIRETLPGKDLIERLIKTEVKQENELIPFDNEISAHPDQVDYIQQAIKIRKKPQNLRTEQEEQFLSSVQSKDEQRIIDVETEALTNRIDKKQRKVETLEGKGRAKAKNEIKTLAIKRDALTSRRARLGKLKKPIIEAEHQKLDTLLAKRRGLSNEVEQVNEAMAWARKPTENVSKESITNVSNKMASPEGQSALQADNASLTEAADAAPDELDVLTPEQEQAFQFLRDNDELSAEDSDAVDVIDSEIDNQEKYSNIVRGIANCLLGKNR